MKTMFIPKNLRHEGRLDFRKNLNKFTSYTSSGFSILFSMSLIKELQSTTTNIWLLSLLVVFVVFFILFIEYRKVIELRTMFSDKPYSIAALAITIFLSFALSAIGIYLWTNKSLQNKVEMSNDKSTNVLMIENKYAHLIDSVNTLDISENIEYQDLNDQLYYWQSRKPANTEERYELRKNIQDIQKQISKVYNKFDTNKQNTINQLNNRKNIELYSIETKFNSKKDLNTRSNSISLIFLAMVFITEILIVLLAREWAELNGDENNTERNKIIRQYYEQYAVINEILSRKNEITFNDIRYSMFLSNKDPEKDVKPVFYFFGELDILQATKEEALRELTSYYESIIGTVDMLNIK